MAHLVDVCISEAEEAATGIDFEEKEMAEERMRLPARMKCRSVEKQMNMRRPAFLGALLEILPRFIDITEANGEVQNGYYTKQLQTEIGEGDYKHDGHKNRRSLETSRLGPYPAACKHAWEHLRLDTTCNYGLNLLSTPEEWGKLGPLAQTTPADVKNRVTTERKKPQQVPLTDTIELPAPMTAPTATDSPAPAAAPTATHMATITTATTAPYQQNASTLSEGLTSPVSQHGSSQWAPSNIAKLGERTNTPGNMVIYRN